MRGANIWSVTTCQCAFVCIHILVNAHRTALGASRSVCVGKSSERKQGGGGEKR